MRQIFKYQGKDDEWHQASCDKVEIKFYRQTPVHICNQCGHYAEKDLPEACSFCGSVNSFVMLPIGRRDRIEMVLSNPDIVPDLGKGEIKSLQINTIEFLCEMKNCLVVEVDSLPKIAVTVSSADFHFALPERKRSTPITTEYV